MDKPQVVDTQTLASTRFLSLYEMTFEGGNHYFVASRRPKEQLMALREDRSGMPLPDAVSCCLVLAQPEAEPVLVLSWEYRYPTGQYVLSIPSGLIDEREGESDDPLCAAMAREIAEETGLVLGQDDALWVINPFLYNTPGMTDESTALLCAVAHREDASDLSQAGAEGSERFAGFVLLTQDEVRQVLANGCDAYGQPYPMVTWAAMMYFACDLWRTQGGNAA